jgi:hypothetical protein
MYDVRPEASRHIRNKGGNVWKIKLMDFKQTVWTSISETCKGHP